MSRLHRWLLPALLLAMPSASVAGEMPRRIAFSVPVTVSAGGDIKAGTFEGIRGAVADVVRTELESQPFVPAQLEDGPVTSTVLVDGVVVLIPVGDEFDVAIEGLRTQPRLLEWRPADYSREALRGRQDGVIALVLEIGGDGDVLGHRIVDGGNRDFIEAAREAVADWHFQPPVDGQEFEVGAAFWFHGNWRDVEEPVVACTIAPRWAHLPGDDGCLRTSETTGAVMVRSDRDVSGAQHVLRTPAPPSTGGYPFEAP